MTPDNQLTQLATVFPETAEELQLQGSTAPWLPMPGEPPLDYLMFCWWRDAGTSRPRLRNKDKRASRWSWYERATLYDEWQAEHPGEPICSAAEMRKEALTSIRIGGRILKTELAKYAVQSESSGQPIVSLDALVGMLEKLVKLERLLNGESTENVSIRGQVDLTNLTDEQLAVLADMAEKASAPKAT